MQPTGTMAVEHDVRNLETARGTYRIAVWEPADLDSPAALILYAPGWGNAADDSASLLADLASHGYVTVAFDDVSHDPVRPRESPQEVADRTAAMRSDSPAAYRASFAMADRRVGLAADKAKAILDSLLASPDFASRVDSARIGFLGFSFGGATGVELALNDPRLKAVVNLDGWLFGRSTRERLRTPYLLIYSRESFPAESALYARDAVERMFAERCVYDVALHTALLRQAGFFWLKATRSKHEELNDHALRWNMEQPFGLLGRSGAELRERRQAHLEVIRRFFDRYLRGRRNAFPSATEDYPGDLVTVEGTDLLPASTPEARTNSAGL